LRNLPPDSSLSDQNAGGLETPPPVELSSQSAVCTSANIAGPSQRVLTDCDVMGLGQIDANENNRAGPSKKVNNDRNLGKSKRLVQNSNAF